MAPSAESAPDTDDLTKEVRTEAAEIKDDIQETKKEAEQARESGNDERADRLEKSVIALETKLDTVVKQLTALADRPFHPAPEAEKEADPAADEKAGTGDQDQDQADDDTPKKPTRTYSRGWFGSRASSED